MLGRPKYQVGDKVSFEMSYDNKKFNLEGVIEIVDAFGTYFYKDGPSYDIMVDDFNNKGRCLCKHIPEKIVKKCKATNADE